MAFVIVAGEMSDVDYCSVYGPYPTYDAAEAVAEEKVKAGEITLDADDQLDFRVMELKN